MLITIVVVICALFLLLAFIMLPGDSSARQRAPFWGRNFAHRGLYQRDQSVPENSLAAFVAAVDAGYGIELDLQLSKDGQVVVFHDDDLLRVCSEPKTVADYTAEQLQRMQLFESRQKIPLLSEVLEVVNGAVPLIIELKSSPRNKELCQATWKLLRQYDGDFCIESFDPRLIHRFKRHAPGILRGQLAAPPKALAQGIFGFLVGNLLCCFVGRPQFIAYQAGKHPALVQVAERFAMRVAWTVRSAREAETVAPQADAIIFEFYRPEPYFKEALAVPAQTVREAGEPDWEQLEQQGLLPEKQQQNPKNQSSKKNEKE